MSTANELHEIIHGWQNFGKTKAYADFVQYLLAHKSCLEAGLFQQAKAADKSHEISFTCGKLELINEILNLPTTLEVRYQKELGKLKN